MNSLKKNGNDKFSENNQENIIVGYIASILGICSLFPLLLSVIKKQSTSEMPFAWMILLLSSSACWLYYGVSNDILPTKISSTVFTLTYIFLIYFKCTVG